MLEVGRTSGGRCTATRRSPESARTMSATAPSGRSWRLTVPGRGASETMHDPANASSRRCFAPQATSRRAATAGSAKGIGATRRPASSAIEREFQEAATAATALFGDAHPQGPGGDEVGPEVGVMSDWLGGAHPARIRLLGEEAGKGLPDELLFLGQCEVHVRKPLFTLFRFLTASGCENMLLLLEKSRLRYCVLPMHQAGLEWGFRAAQRHRLRSVFRHVLR